jgi:hypothetical protein
VSRSAIQVPSGSRSSAATAPVDADLMGLKKALVLHHEERREIGGIDHVSLEPTRIRLREDLRGDVGRAAAEVLDRNAMLLLESGDDGIDDLRVEACVEDDLALRAGLVEVNLRRLEWSCFRGSRGGPADVDESRSGGERLQHGSTREFLHRLPPIRRFPRGAAWLPPYCRRPARNNSGDRDRAAARESGRLARKCTNVDTFRGHPGSVDRRRSDGDRLKRTLHRA